MKTDHKSSPCHYVTGELNSGKNFQGGRVNLKRDYKGTKLGKSLELLTGE